MIPSRDRPKELKVAVDSVYGMASDPENLAIAVYVDEDQKELYKGTVAYVSGPRVGPATAADGMAKTFDDFDIYGLITDDSVIVTPGWDDWLRGQLEGQVAVASPSHNHGVHMDMPFVSKRWLDAVGWFSLPGCIHYAWPSAIYVIALASGAKISHADIESFRILHDQLSTDRGPDFVQDALTLYNFILDGLAQASERVKRAINED